MCCLSCVVTVQIGQITVCNSWAILENVYFKFFMGNNYIDQASIYRQNMQNVYRIKVIYIIILEQFRNNFYEISK